MSGPEDRRFTGRHMLIWVLSFFGVVMAVNAVMVWFALTTHHEEIKRTATAGTVQEKTVWPT